MTRRREVYAGLAPRHVRPGTFFVKRDGLVLIETSNPREAQRAAYKRGDGAVATDHRGVVLGMGA